MGPHIQSLPPKSHPSRDEVWWTLHRIYIYTLWTMYWNAHKSMHPPTDAQAQSCSNKKKKQRAKANSPPTPPQFSAKWTRTMYSNNLRNALAASHNDILLSLLALQAEEAAPAQHLTHAQPGRKRAHQQDPTQPPTTPSQPAPTHSEHKRAKRFKEAWHTMISSAAKADILTAPLQRDGFRTGKRDQQGNVVGPPQL